MRCNHQLSHWYLAEADFDRSGSVFWHLRVAEGDHLTERSEGRKLPQHKTRALAVLRKLKTLLGGAPGGVQRGPRRGTAPNRPPLPHAGKAKSHSAQASKLRRTAKLPCPKGNKQKKRALAYAKARYKSFCGDGGLGEGELFEKSSPSPNVFHYPISSVSTIWRAAAVSSKRRTGRLVGKS